MKKANLLAAIALAAVTTTGAPAFAAQGLNQSVWHNIPEYAWAPQPQDITSEQAWAAATTPDYTFVNTVDSFNYSNSNFGPGAPTIAAFFGADASGAALTDNAYPGFFAVDASGFLYAPTTGSYTFNLGNTFNGQDDAARVTVDGKIVAEQNFQATYADYSDTLTLTQGYHSFDMFYFQTEGGYGLNLIATGPNGGPIAFTTNTVAAPEPTTWAMLMVGFAGLGFAGLRQTRTARAIAVA